MKRYAWLVCLFLCFLFTNIPAQDQSNFAQFYLNPYLINPSFAGVDGQSVFSLIYRRQWVNIDGGPAIANVSFHAPVTNKASVGISITNDKKGLLNNTGMLFSFTYNVPLAEHSFVRFGLSAGGSWNTIDLEKFGSSTDPALASLLNKNASIIGNAGISFQHKLFHFGVAMPSIFSPSYVSKDAFNITEIKPFQSLILNASNRFYFNNNKNIFEPYLIYRMNTNLPSQFEFAGIVHLNHVIWVGGSYKQDFGVSALGGIKIQNIMAIGGSYSLKNSGINELNSPSFEVSLSYLFGKPKKGLHVYSFVNTVKEKEKKPIHPTSTEAIAAKKKREEEEHKKQLAEQAKQKEAAAIRKKQEQDALAKTEVKKTEVITENKNPVNTPPEVIKKDTVAVTHRPRFSKKLYEPAQSEQDSVAEHEKETLQRLEAHAANPTEEHKQAPDVHPNAERHEFVKQGSHPEELEVADYVIGGAFKSSGNAKHFADGLSKLGFKAKYGHLTEKNLWYVYLIQTNDINVARAERDKMRKLLLLRDAWLLTVQH